jgi:hypothetical protein
MPAVSSSLVTIHFKQAILIHILWRVFITKNIQKSLVSQKIVARKESTETIVYKLYLLQSGDFGEYDYHSPYYILSFVFHDQDLDLTSALDILNQKLYSLGLGTAAIHTGPVIRQEEIYNAIDLNTRRKIMRVLLTF